MKYMYYKPKDCINCKFEPDSCKYKVIDKRQLRKLEKTADKNGVWDRFYCKSHKYRRLKIGRA